MPKRTRSEFEDEEETHSTSTSSAGDEPVLSHAAKRAARKRQKKGEVATEVPSKPARGFSVWVGNLNWKTRPEALKAFFADVGEPTRVHLPAKALHGNVASKSPTNSG
jgi:RNA recognition motif-containing protein